MASHGADADSFKPAAFSVEPQGERKTATVSFGFTKTANKFKPLTGDAPIKKSDRDYLTGIDGNELQRCVFYANANKMFRYRVAVTFPIVAHYWNH